jgi:hypothetical protein
MSMAEFYSNKEISTEDIDHDMVGDVQMPERYRDDANHYDSIIMTTTGWTSSKRYTRANHWCTSTCI